MIEIPVASPSQLEETGRYLIFYQPDELEATSDIANNLAGISMLASPKDAEFVTASDAWRTSDTIVVPSIGVAICSAAPEQILRLQSAGQGPIKYVRKEMIFSIAQNISGDYLRGYQDATNNLINQLLHLENNTNGDFGIQDFVSYRDNADFTWGLQSTGVDQTKLSGAGVSVAILDTGIDFAHPDFSTREIERRSFVDGVATADDDNGHGTHCAGTLCGPKKPSNGPRYGVAPQVKLFVGKVMNANGNGNEGDILHGIGWALQNGCRIISMSLGKKVDKGTPPDIDYENIGRMAMASNCLLIAAAGNDSQRPDVSPVCIPANASSIMAVGAVDRRLTIYNRSNAGINPNGGNIDLVGPGVEIYSCKRSPLLYGTETGTSMATPHVSGIAALLMEANPELPAAQIWQMLTKLSRKLAIPSIDAGSGLVQIQS